MADPRSRRDRNNNEPDPKRSRLEDSLRCSLHGVDELLETGLPLKADIRPHLDVTVREVDGDGRVLRLTSTHLTRPDRYHQPRKKYDMYRFPPDMLERLNALNRPAQDRNAPHVKILDGDTRYTHDEAAQMAYTIDKQFSYLSVSRTSVGKACTIKVKPLVTAKPIIMFPKNEDYEFTEEEMAKLEQVNAEETEPDSKTFLLTLSCDSSLVRQAIRQLRNTVMRYYAFVDVDLDGISVYISKRREANFSKKARNAFPEGHGDYMEFLVHRSAGVSSLEAIEMMAKVVRDSPKSFAYIKFPGNNKTSCTQMVKASRIAAAVVSEVNTAKATSDWLKVGNFRYCFQPGTTLRAHVTHHYTVALRSIPLQCMDELYRRFETCRTSGFINYFDLAGDNPEYRLAVPILRQDWLAFFELVLQPRGTEDDKILEQFRNCFLRRDPSSKPSTNSIESLKDPFLKRFMSNYCDFDSRVDERERIRKAYYSVDKKSRTFLQKYQWCVWNRLATRRIRQEPRNVQMGDLVLCDDLGTRRAGYECTSLPMTSLVIPLPTSVAIYSEDLSLYCQQLLSQDGLTLKQFALDGPEELLGGFRTVICRPQDLQLHEVRYRDKEDVIVLNDRDALDRKPDSEDSRQSQMKFYGADSSRQNTSDHKYVDDYKTVLTYPGGDSGAVVASLKLPMLTSLNMLMREVMKWDKQVV